MSNNTLNAALRRLGYATDEQTPHGFRSTASTLLHEQGYPPDLIELQLAHQERHAVSAAYNKAPRLAEHRQMMQGWADYLYHLKKDHEQAAADPTRTTQNGRYPALRNCMSENRVSVGRAQYRRHDFHCLDEQGWRPNLTERQLAHPERK